MSTLALLGIGAVSIALLLVLIIRWQVHAFVAMMLVSFLVAFATGMPIGDIISTLIAGMGGTLGSVAILVALGSMLGRMIEVSGGAASLANRFTQLLGPTRVPMALTAAALVLAIPVFFDVGFIILVPIVYGFCKAAGVNPIKFGLPVAGIMLAAHVVVTPHPGIVGGAAIVKGDIGWIAIIGLAICIPLAALSQVVSGWLNRKGYPLLPTTAEQFAAFGNSQEGAESKAPKAAATPGVGTIFALMVAVGLAMFLLGRNQGWNRERTNAIMESALPPAATVILVTGAGGVFAKVLTASGIGTALSQSLTATHLPLILLAFIISLALRAAQGSATVAIITTCGLLADDIAGGGYSPLQVALLTVAIGFGSLGLSHVNDSGFWIVARYLGLSVGDGLRTWTVLTTVLGLAGFALTALLWALVA